MPSVDLLRWRRQAPRWFTLTQVDMGGEVGTLYGWHVTLQPQVGRDDYHDRAARDADAMEWGIWCARYGEGQERRARGESR